MVIVLLLVLLFFCFMMQFLTSSFVFHTGGKATLTGIVKASALGFLLMFFMLLMFLLGPASFDMPGMFLRVWIDLGIVPVTIVMFCKGVQGFRANSRLAMSCLGAGSISMSFLLLIQILIPFAAVGGLTSRYATYAYIFLDQLKGYELHNEPLRYALFLTALIWVVSFIWSYKIAKSVQPVTALENN